MLLECKDAFYGGAAGGGKGSANTALIATPYGFRKMGDLKVGEKICNPNGGNSTIIYKYELGKKQLYKFTFADGSSTEVTSDHIWKYSVARKGKWKKSGLEWKLALTTQLIEMINNGREILIPLCNPVQFTKSYRYDYRKIHPYVLGVLLGDGWMTNNQIGFASIDDEIINKMSYHTGFEWKRYDISYRVTGEDKKQLDYWLKKLDLMNKKSNNKFIPEQYKYGTIRQRYELLQGLMDTDGTVSEDGKAYFCSISKQLANDVKWLVHSLGGRATIFTKPGKYRDVNGKIIECQLAYNVYIRMPDNSRLFHLKRKKERANIYNAGRFELKRKIVSIEATTIEEASCIKVDNPDGLYIVDDFIVTHNSDALLMAALQYVDVPGYAALLIRDTYQNLVMPGALLERSDTWLAGTDAKWDSQAKTWLFPTTIKLKNGKTVPGKPASITFGYLDKDKDHLRYKSAEFQFIGLDEATDLRWNQIIYLFSRLRRLKGHNVPLRFRLASNPGGISHNEIKNKYVDPKTRKRGVAFIPAGLSDNPYLEADEYRDSLSNLDPTTREQLMNGDWNVKKSSNTFLREWWVLCDERWHKDEIMTAVRYWDLASTDEKSKVTKEPCYTAGVRMVRHKDGIRVMVDDVIRVRKDPNTLRKILRQTADIDRTLYPDIVTVVEHDPGQAGDWQVSDLRRNVFSDIPFKSPRPSGSKVVRAMPYANKAGDGYVLLLKGQWNADYIDEAEDFPDGAFADQIDSSSGAYKEVMGGLTGGLRVRSIGGLSSKRGKK